MLIFVHIPKAGGRTFNHILRQQYGTRFCRVDRPPTWPRYWPKDYAPEAFSKSCMAFSSHAAYGVHEVFGCEAYYVTIVREPLERFISYYNYARKEKTHHHHAVASKTTISEFYEYMEQIRSGELGNSQCCLLSQRKDFETARHFVDNKFLLSAPLEFFSQFVSILAQRFDWQVDEYEVRNKSDKFATFQNISSQLRSMVYEKNQEDLKLYDYVKTKFVDEHLG